MSNITRIIKKLWEHKIVRFAAIGSFNSLLDITLLMIGYKIFGLPQVLANTISVSISITCSYFLNHKIVFRDPGGYSFKKYLHFFVITGLGIIVIQDLTIYLVTYKFWVINAHRAVIILHQSLSAKTLEILGAKVTAILIAMVWNFLMYKYVVFRHKPADGEDEVIIA